MSRDRLQQNDGSMAKSPKVCGGVVMERERSMIRRSMNSMLRVALVGVMAMVFGVAGFVSNSDAGNYITDPGSGTYGGEAVTWTTCATTSVGMVGVLKSVASLPSAGSYACADANLDYTGAANTVISGFVYTTAFASDMELSDVTADVYLRENDGTTDSVRVEVGYYSGGTFTSMGSATVAINARQTFTFTISGVLGTAPAGSNLGMQVVIADAVAGADRQYFGTADDATGVQRLAVTETPVSGCAATTSNDLGGSAASSTQVDLTWTYDSGNNDYYNVYRDGLQINAANVVTGSYSDTTAAQNTTYDYTVRGYNTTDTCESGDSNTFNVTTPSCTPDAAPVISGTVNGDPIDICSVVADGTNTTTNYKVTEGGGSADMDPNGTYIEAENYNRLVAIGAPNTGLVADAAANGGFAMETTNGGTSNTADGDRLEYDVNFPTGGAYYFWLRMLNSGTGDSGFFGIDGAMVGAVTQITDGAYYWTNSSQTGALSTTVTAGTHTINIWGRENVFIDGIFITTDNGTPADFEGAAGENTGTIPAIATVLDPTNTSTTLYDAAACSVPTGTWTDGSQDIEITYTDSCGTTGQTTTGTFNFTSCNDLDLATLTTSDPGTAIGTITIQTAVGGEATPAGLTASMSINIAGAGACNVSGGSMTLNGANMEYVWDTSACGIGSVVNGITIDVSGTDPDCGTTVNAAQITGVSIDNMCVETETVTVSNPGVITLATPITVALGGFGGNTPEWSADGGSNWYANGVDYTPPSCASGAVTFTARANGSCGAITGETDPVNTTYDTTVTGSIAVVGAQSLSGSPIDLTSIVNLTDMDTATLTYSVDVASGSPSAQTDDFSAATLGAAGRPTFGNWTGVNGSDATNGWMASTAGTASAGTGPSAGNGGQYVVLESSPTSAAPSTATMGNGTGGASENNSTASYMYVDRNNPATANGTVTDVSIVVTQEGTSSNIKFYTCAMTGNDCTITAQTGWLTVTATGVQSWSGLNLTVNNGDMIGFVGEANGPLTGRDTNNIQYQYVNTSGARPTDGNTYTFQNSGTNAQAIMMEATYSYGGGGDADATDGVDLTSGSTQYLESNVINASAQALTLTFDYNMNVGDNGDAVLDVEAYNGSAWVDATGGVVNTGSTGDVWASSGAIDLSSYNNANFQVRIRYDVGTGTTSLNDVAVDNMVITGTPTISTNNYTYAQAQSVDTSSWTAGAIPLTVDGEDICAGARTDGPTDFDWIDCTDTEIVTAVNPGVLGGSTQITATLDGTGGSSPMVRWSIDGGAFTAWVASDTSLNPPASSTGNIVIEASATGSCGGTIYAAAQVNTTYDTTCSDPGAAVTLAAIAQPITGTITGISATSNRAQAVFVSLDNASWVATGTLDYIPLAQSTGSQDFYAQSTDDCGTIITDTFSRTFDSRTNNLLVLPASANQQGLNGVTITMPYQGDKDGNATFRYQYQQDGGGYTAWSAPVTDADGTSPKTFSLSGLTLDALVDINVQYIDAGVDHNGNLDPQDLQIQLVGWVDNGLLHNSLRFACDKIGYAKEADCTANGGVWDETKKWAAGWGTTDGQYGPIMCATCHAKNSGNIKRVQSAVPAVYPGNGVTFASTVDGSSDFGDDSDNHNNSTNVCEVCHSVTSYHRFDTTNDPDGGGPLTAQSNLTHKNNTDCIGCHTHNTGFRASCDSCHSSPPIDLAGLDSTSNAGAGTGSVTAGAHAVHTPLFADCNTCHTGWEAADEMPKGDDSGDINIGFSAFGSTAGSYTGQSGVSYNGAGGAGGLTCNTVYCHGGTLSGTGPVWTDTAAACGSCHAGTAVTVSALPSGTSHNTHANAQGLACSACHGANGAGPTGHVDGDVTWNVGSLPGTSPTYSGSATGTAGNRAPSGTYGTCSNIACHNNVATPAWDGTANCTTCHAAPPSSNAHNAHYTAKSWTPDNAGAFCDSCHPDNTSGHSDVTDSTIEVNVGWNGTTCNSTGTGCHNGNTTPAWTTSTITCTDCHTVGGTNSATVANPISGLHDMAAAGVQKHDNSISGGCEACHTKTSIGGHWDGTASAATPNFTSAQVGITAMTGGSYTDAGGTATSRGTCATSCHADNGNWARQWSTAADSTATAVGNTRCDVCHGQWTTWAAGTTHYKAGGSNSASNGQGGGHEPATADCDRCHVYTSGSARHDTATHEIDVNSNTTQYSRTNNTYGSGTAGCVQCHSATAAGYNFPISYFASNPVNGSVIPMPACNSCHDSAVAASKGAPAVDASSTHVDADGTGGTYTAGTCEDCHSGHADGTVGANDVEIPTTSVTFAAANKYLTHGGGAIKLGGTATSGSTEAEMCWGCHDANGISEWVTNAGTGSTYDYGDLYTTLTGTTKTSNWTTGFWRSGNGRTNADLFYYKRGAVASTHAAKTSTGAGTTTREGVDDIERSVALIVTTFTAPIPTV